MGTVDPKVKPIIDEYVKKERERYPELEAVVLCGSQANGMATAHSDMDLCYMGRFSEFKRKFDRFQSYDFQIMMAPWNWYKEVITGYERKGNIGTITGMLGNGICLWCNAAQKWTELQEEAITYYISGPAPAFPEELTRIRRRITDYWHNFVDADDDVASVWLRNRLLQECVDAHFVIRGWWAVKPKYQMNELRLKDAALAGYITECLRQADGEKSLRTICEYVLRPIGGFMRSC